MPTTLTKKDDGSQIKKQKSINDAAFYSQRMPPMKDSPAHPRFPLPPVLHACKEIHR
jgi:hypothetical protein